MTLQFVPSHRHTTGAPRHAGRNVTLSFLPATLTLVVLLAAGSAHGQRPVRLQQRVKPAFRITPMVQRFEAPRGKLLRFEFEVEALERPTSLRILPVALRQQENGVIMPDEDAPAPAALRLESPGALELKATDKAILRGRVRVPHSDAPFHSFGILVKDLGRVIDGKVPRGADGGERHVGLRFVTQYLLRCDITVKGARGGDMMKLEMPSGDFAQRNGQPVARVWVTNPTDSPYEFQLRCRVKTPEVHAVRRPFKLVLPVRANLNPPERFEARILAHSRVRLEAPLPYPLFPGAHQLEVVLLSGRRPLKQATFPLAVHAGDFPAQDASVVLVGRDVVLTPAHVELSLRKRGKRFQTFVVANQRAEPVEVTVTPTGRREAAPPDWLVARPEKFTLPPRMRRKVLVALSARSRPKSHQYGLLQVNVASRGGGKPVSHDLSVALLSREAEVQPKLQAGPLRWDAGRQEYVTDVTNVGSVHVPLRGRLTLTDRFGRPQSFLAGYGRWLLPGDTTQLPFRLSGPLPEASYQVKAEIATSEGAEPIVLEDVLRTHPVSIEPERNP